MYTKRVQRLNDLIEGALPMLEEAANLIDIIRENSYNRANQDYGREEVDIIWQSLRKAHEYLHDASWHFTEVPWSSPKPIVQEDYASAY